MEIERLSDALVARHNVLEAAVRNEAPDGADHGHGTAQHDHWVAAWSAALAEMELDVHRVEQVLSAVHRGAEMPPAADLLSRRWEAPSNLGPLPHPLLARAQKLLLRQQQLAAEVAEATVQTRRHAHLASSIREQPPTQAVYLDLAL